jgi:CBS domain-containing protein
MAKKVTTVRKDTPVLEAARILVDQKITGMPVVDAENNLVGILSEFDVLRLLVEEGACKDLTVEAFMSRNVMSFDDSASAVDICDFFLNNVGKRRVPITHDGKLVGLVSRADILKLIVKIRNIA